MDEEKKYLRNSALKKFKKNFSFEDFHNFHEICLNGGHELVFLLL